jgi:hypothetical protein
MQPVKSFDLVGTGRDFGGSIHVEWDCEAKLPGDRSEWVLWNDYVDEFVHQALDDSHVPYEASRSIVDGKAFDLTYEWYGDIPQLVKDWKEAMAKILKGISWHECEVCGWITFTFYNPYTQVTEVRGSCDCTCEDFTDMLIEEEADKDAQYSNRISDFRERGVDFCEAQ